MPILRTRAKVMEPLAWAFPPEALDDHQLRHLPAEQSVPASAQRPPLLFVHGLGHGNWVFDEHWLPAAAAQGFDAYAVSLRGHPGAPSAAERPTLRDYTHDVLQAIAALPAPPVLIGHSMGALVVQRVLERYPARGAALVTPLGDRHGFGVAARLARRAPAQLARALVGLPLRFEARHLFAGLDAHEADRHIRRQVRDSSVAQYQTVLPRRRHTARCPVLVLGAADDALVPPADIVRTARRYGSTARFLAGGHALMLDRDWSRPLQVLLDWVDAIPDPPRPAVR